MEDLVLQVAEQENVANALLTNFAKACVDRGALVAQTNPDAKEIQENGAVLELTGKQLGLFISRLIVNSAELKKQLDSYGLIIEVPLNTPEFDKIPESA